MQNYVFIYEKKMEYTKLLDASFESPELIAVVPCSGTGAIRFYFKSFLGLYEFHTMERDFRNCVTTRKKGKIDKVFKEIYMQYAIIYRKRLNERKIIIKI